jgi:hypothetical protein
MKVELTFLGLVVHVASSSRSSWWFEVRTWFDLGCASTMPYAESSCADRLKKEMKKMLLWKLWAYFKLTDESCCIQLSHTFVVD